MNVVRFNPPVKQGKKMPVFLNTIWFRKNMKSFCRKCRRGKAEGPPKSIKKKMGEREVGGGIIIDKEN